MRLGIKDIQTHIVPLLTAPIRLQEYGVGLFDAIPTKSALKKAIKKQLITVNKNVASTATFINGGETIVFDQSDQPQLHKKINLSLDVLYQDEHFAAIAKPAGILVSGNSFKTIANGLSQNLTRSLLPDAATPTPVHRLDYATTGVLLVGKTNESVRRLNKMFEEKTIQKVYYAVTIGKMNVSGSINAPIDGKDAISNYSTVVTVTSDRFTCLNLVKLTPETGRRHQLRIHLSSIGNPILGDKEYGVEPLILSGKGLYLHAYSLQFNHPITNEKIFLNSDLPVRYCKIFPKSNQNNKQP